MSDFGNTTMPVARKLHRCHWCGEDIVVGEKYSRFVGIWGGDWQNNPMHLECASAYHDSDPYGDDGYELYQCKRGSSEQR